MKAIILLLGVSILLSIACSKTAEVDVAANVPETESVVEPGPDDRKPPIYVHIASMSSDQLCERLVSIDTLPTFDPNITDPIYESLMAKGDDAIPCLVEKISDTTAMPDPRYSVPHWQHFTVGDTAVFTLVDILGKADEEREKLHIEMLPPKYAKEWETNGIYAYFNYVSEPKNRKALQNWWKNWLKQNKN